MPRSSQVTTSVPCPSAASTSAAGGAAPRARSASRASGGPAPGRPGGGGRPRPGRSARSSRRPAQQLGDGPGPAHRRRLPGVRRLPPGAAFRAATGLGRDAAERADGRRLLLDVGQAAAGQLEVGELLERAAQGVGVGPARLLDAPVGRPRAPLIEPLMACGVSPASSRAAMASTSRTRRAMQRHEAGRPTRPARAARGTRAWRPRRRARRARRRAPQTWRSADGAAAASTSSTPIVRARAVLERELLELAQQALLAVADGATSACAAARSSVDAEPRGLADSPLAAAPAAFSAARRRPRRRPPRPPRERRRRLGAALLAGEERDRRVGRDARQRGARCASTSASFQRSTPSTMTKRRPMRERHRAQRRRDRLGGGGVALEDLDAAGARLAPRRARAAARGARRCGRGRRRGSGRRA